MTTQKQEGRFSRVLSSVVEDEKMDTLFYLFKEMSRLRLLSGLNVHARAQLRDVTQAVGRSHRGGLHIISETLTKKYSNVTPFMLFDNIILVKYMCFLRGGDLFWCLPLSPTSCFYLVYFIYHLVHCIL